jgi:hypothetical protein
MAEGTWLEEQQSQRIATYYLDSRDGRTFLEMFPLTSQAYMGVWDVSIPSGR